jgi:hypothetical protein
MLTNVCLQQALEVREKNRQQQQRRLKPSDLFDWPSSSQLMQVSFSLFKDMLYIYLYI